MSSIITTNISYKVVKEFDTEALITFLIRKKIDFNENEIQIFHDQGINGDSFLMLNEKKLKEYKIQIGPRVKLINLINNLNNQKQSADIDSGPPKKCLKLIKDFEENDDEEKPMKWLKQAKETNKALFHDNPNIVINGNYIPDVSDFAKFITSGIFVDKSLFIMEFMIYGEQANLITRPHQFGKSTNLSMLYTFLTPTFTEEEKIQRLSLFKDLRISEFNWFIKLNFGNWPVIYISFKDLNIKSWQLMLNSLKQKMVKLYEKHRYILDDKKLSNTNEKFFKKILNGTTDQSYLTDALSSLAEYLYIYFNKRSIILIDEYDWPMKNTEKINYDDVNFLFQSMYSSVAKDNEYVHKILFVGLLPISFLSGLNNVEHFPIHILPSIHKRAYFSDSFGFTQKEIEALIRKSILKNINLSDLSSYYNGYQTSIGTNIYNPYSMISFLKNGVITNYWINSGSEKTLVGYLKKCDQSIKEKIQKLFYSFYSSQNDKLFVKVKLMSCLQYDIFKKKELEIDAVFTLLYYSGYLTAKMDGANARLKGEVVEFWKNTKIKLMIPNREVAEQWREWIYEIIGTDQVKMNKNIYNLLFKKDIKTFCKEFPAIYMDMVSYHDIGDTTRTKLHEGWYHAFVLGSLAMYHGDDYQVVSNREVGLDRADIRIISTNKEYNTNITFEFKVALSEDCDMMESCAEKGLNQIDEKNYRANTPSHVKTIVEVAIAFHKKHAFISAHVLQRIEKGSSISSNWKISLTAKSESFQMQRDTVSNFSKNKSDDDSATSTVCKNSLKRCKGITTTNNRCRRTVKFGNYCYQHKNQKNLRS
ncbi:AAA family ATPase [Rhizophagus irregularis DAOM 181602=DAOM 197198]|nr:AAA family ATPase [Rhizophagus irregularis DAOM 181602=DAOM 197198]